MEQYIIKGGNPLVGEVEIGGAKNAALAILAAAIMTDETVTIDNLPDVNDINVLLEAISGIGAEVDRIDRHTVRINGSNIENFDIEYDYIKKIRASYYLLGALLGKYKRAEVALPGGCNIGSRPIDQHLKGFRALGAYVDIEHGKIIAEAERLIGKHIYFDVVSVGATINVMMAASMAEGLTILENVAKEPHVVDVANFLNSMGANIRGAGTDVIKIRGEEVAKGEILVDYYLALEPPNPEKEIEGIGANVDQLIAYLKNSHSYYLENRMFSIQEQLKEISEGCEQQHQQILNLFFNEYKNEVIRHFDYEEVTVFPYISNMVKGARPEDYEIGVFRENHSNIDDKLNDLKNIIMKYLPGDTLSDMRIRVLFGIFALEEDLSKHSLIEDKILVPLVMKLEQRYAKQ